MIYMKNKLRVSFDLFLIFFYVAIFTIGGGVAMLPLLERIIVDKKKYLDEKDFLELFSLTQILPGSFMIHMAAFVGYRVVGFIGTLFCCIAIALPPLIIITLIAIFYTQFIQFTLVEKLLLGILAGVVGEVSGITLRMLKKIKFDAFKIFLIVLTITLIFILEINPIYVIVIGGILGILSGLIKGAK